MVWLLLFAINFVRWYLSANGTAVVTFTFHQSMYMFMENVGNGTVCVEKNGTSGQDITITVSGGMSELFSKLFILFKYL